MHQGQRKFAKASDSDIDVSLQILQLESSARRELLALEVAAASRQRTADIERVRSIALDARIEVETVLVRTEAIVLLNACAHV